MIRVAEDNSVFGKFNKHFESLRIGKVDKIGVNRRLKYFKVAMSGYWNGSYYNSSGYYEALEYTAYLSKR